MYGIIYKATNTANGKVYVGQTTKTLAQRKGNHVFRAKKGDRRDNFHIALIEHGVSAFVWEQIDTAESQAELDRKEKAWIEKFNADNSEYGYNSKEGGSKGFRLTPEHRRKIGEAQKGEKNHIYGKHPSEETLKKMRAAHKGNKHLLGHVHSTETRIKMSLSQNGIGKETARQIKIDLASGMRGVDIARKYSISRSLVSGIKTGQLWNWVQITA